MLSHWLPEGAEVGEECKLDLQSGVGGVSRQLCCVTHEGRRMNWHFQVRGKGSAVLEASFLLSVLVTVIIKWGH